VCCAMLCCAPMGCVFPVMPAIVLVSALLTAGPLSMPAAAACEHWLILLPCDAGDGSAAAVCPGEWCPHVAQTGGALPAGG
jgi:hypothetical protein